MITGLIQDQESPDSDTYRAMRGESIIDLVRDDLDTLERQDMSASDKVKIEAWKELLDGIPFQPYVSCSSLSEGLGLLDLESQFEPSASVATEIANGLDRADICAKVAALSVACNTNPVVFLKFPGNYSYRALGVEMSTPTMGHRTGAASLTGTCVDDITNMIHTIDKYYAEKFAYLISTLDDISEGDTTLLDNSAVVWFQQHSDGAAFNLNNMPIIQAGSCGGYFKPGHAVNVDDGSPDLHRGNSSLCESITNITNHREFGTPEEFGNAPINKYYCNLMNAIGVRAGPDGFPAVGGDQEVTHYGMYDRTEDFVSGGANPANITDPGEFLDLKA